MLLKFLWQLIQSYMTTNKVQGPHFTWYMISVLRNLKLGRQRINTSPIIYKLYNKFLKIHESQIGLKLEQGSNLKFRRI